ncbi:flavoprotein [Bacillus salacetis]|uniref:Flavoprotein n=1 Tax=Bacillus salacetis TaxID=2315464 RepID=A0A3A1R3K7_9BACI|nr:flavoprotein [Bacillus salacetis]RIW37298.1 flavoprotein [Bacillus salacetis]
MDFQTFLDQFLDSWSHSNLEELSNMIAEDYQAREITSDGELVDFGYEQSIEGWKQGFQFVKESGSEWVLKTLSTMPLRDNEVMAIISASMIIDGYPLETANIFFDTFKQTEEGWILSRSYVEAGARVDLVKTAL